MPDEIDPGFESPIDENVPDAQDAPPEAAQEAQDASPESMGHADEDAGDTAEQLLDKVHAAVSQANSQAADQVRPGPAPPAGSAPMSLKSFEPGQSREMPAELDLLADVNLNVKIELGRTRMLVDDVLKLADGAVVELDKLAGDPVDIYVNERHVAKGEVLVLNDNFCVRINEIVDPDERKAG